MTKLQKDKLEGDAKTLIDISRMLENEGRFKVLPSVLLGIADDIQESLSRKVVIDNDQKRA